MAKPDPGVNRLSSSIADAAGDMLDVVVLEVNRPESTKESILKVINDVRLRMERGLRVRE